MIQNIGIEIKYGFRSGKLLVLLACFLFFALLTPLMLKFILPGILKSQGVSSQELSGLMNITQIGCIQIYMNDVFEMGTIIVAFTLCGLLAQEIRDNTLVLPLCSGKHFSNIVGAKLLIFGFALILISLTALMANYLYAGFLFSFDVGLFSIIRAGILQGIYMNFLLACIIFWGAVAKKPIPTGFLTLATAFGLHFVGSLLDIHVWLPSGLLEQALHLIESSESSMILTLTITILLIVVMIVLALVRLKSIEWNERQT